MLMAFVKAISRMCSQQLVEVHGIDFRLFRRSLGLMGQDACASGSAEASIGCISCIV